MIDLHLHSNKSDGLDSPSQLIDKALKSNIKAVALTDHDTIDGNHEFVTYAEDKNIIAISGIEFSIKHEPDRDIKDVHIVGLNIDFRSKDLKSALKLQSDGRIKQKEDICKRLRNEFGYNISFEEVRSIASENSVGRPHIVEILIKNNQNLLKEYTKNELFEMISLGGKAYVDREYEANLEEAIHLIDNAGGIPILAHPGIYKVNDREAFVKMCIKAGIKGIEIEYPYDKNRPYYNTDKASWAQNYFPAYYSKIADKYELIKSGGSDYHGGKKNMVIGQVKVPDDYLLKIL
ncbi:MAG: PHP domain-containing protein [Candidatus Lokiarchaeota archaeon]|nr:PHP domain-containing protein [Candidatus Lokiarchaeota archaeon]MBD3199646.1 PHP domain-containing protein [Candidatus Lokiarchaeota archaeon]